MRQHDALRLIRPAREHDVAAHVWPLIFDTPHDHSVLNLVAQSQRLAPIINLDVPIEVAVLGRLRQQTFFEENGVFDF